MGFTLTPEKSEQRNSGSEPLNLGQTRYDFDYLVFPNDLGNEDNSHYMVININVPVRYDKLGVPQARGQYYNTPGAGQLLATDRSKVDQLRYPGTLTPSPAATTAAEYTVIGAEPPPPPVTTPTPSSSSPPTSALLSLQRNTRRITRSIALHMPTPLVYNTHNAYEEISLSALAGKLGTSALAAIFGAGSAAFVAAQKAINIAGGAKQVLKATGEVGGTVSKLLQTPINPAVEILFANTLVRQFTFEVLMAPRNEKESLSMHNIIKTIRFHGAPELSDYVTIPYFGGQIATPGLFWIPPAEFDITFYHKGKENMNILRVNTCVLERIEVDYAPTGVYSTFKNGHPVAARLSMGFRELEPIHKLRVLQGF